MAGIIYLFGPSCSGKSTLGKALEESLGMKWSYVDCDRLIEQGICTEPNANQTIDKIVNEAKEKLVIDAQIPWREKKRKRSLPTTASPSGNIIAARCPSNQNASAV